MTSTTSRSRTSRDPALHALFRAKRDEIARQITALEDRDTSRFVYGSLQLYGGIAPPLALRRGGAARDHPGPQAPSTQSVTAGAFAEAARAEFERYRAVYPDFPVHIEVRDDVSELMVSFGRLLIPEAAAFRAERVEALLHHEVGTHVVTYQNGARQPLTLLTIGLPGYDETQEGLAVLAEYLAGGLDPRRLRVLAARVVAIGKMLDGAGFLEIFESLRDDHRMPARTAWSIAIRVVVGGGSVKDAIYLRGITRLLEALAEGSSLDVLFVGKLALDHVPLVQDLLDREVLQPPWIRPRWLDVPGAQERLERLRAGVRSRTCTKERCRHEACVLRQRRRHRDRRVRDDAAGQGGVAGRARGLVRRGRRRRARGTRRGARGAGARRRVRHGRHARDASWSGSRSATPSGSSWTISMPCSCGTSRSTTCRSGRGRVRWAWSSARCSRPEASRW